MSNLIDCHSHTKHSPDGHNSVDEMCKRAMELSLAAYAITDHCEVNLFYEDGFDKLLPDGVKTILEAKNNYANQLNLLLGIELGQPHSDTKFADEIIDSYPFDFVIGSLHNIKGCKDFAFIDYDEQDVYALLSQYYAEMYAMVQWGRFDVLAHLTYPLRYIEGMAGFSIDMSRFEEPIRAIFTQLAKRGLGIEINTSGLRQQIGRAMPDLPYVKLFRECGGEILSLGSDAHCTDDLGKGIADGIEIAKAAGFTQIAYFKERKPIFISI